MKDGSIKKEIILFLEYKNWCFGGVIGDYIRSILGTKGSTVERKCRELAADGFLERRYVKETKGDWVEVDMLHGTVQYRISPPVNLPLKTASIQASFGREFIHRGA